MINTVLTFGLVGLWKQNKKTMIPHYKVKGEIFILFVDAMIHCDKLKISYSHIVKTYEY